VKADDPARVVIRSPNWLGDVVMSLPAVGAVRRRFPDARLAVAAPDALASLFEYVAGVDQVVSLPRGRASPLRPEREAAALAPSGFDLAILLPNSFAAAWAAWRAGIPGRWGYDTDLRRWLLTRRVTRVRRRPAGEAHHVHHYQRLVRALDMEPGPPAPGLVVPQAVIEAARRRLADRGLEPNVRLVGCAPGAAYGRAKQWPPERWAAFVASLAREGMTCVLLGGAGDRPTIRAIESLLARDSAAGVAPIRTASARAGREPARASWASLAGETDLKHLAALAACCDAFVSNDSGAMHVAAAVGTPVVGIFGPTDEHATGPLASAAPLPVAPHAVVAGDAWCRPCLLRECPIDHRCMTSIGAATVVAAVTRLMTTRSTAPA
jgi:heptosyltransferase-2